MENILDYGKKINKKSIFRKSFFALLPCVCFWSQFYQNFLPRPLPTKKIRVSLKICTQMTLSHWSFSHPTNHCAAFFYSRYFPALPILTILLDRCQMKSFIDDNILIKIKVFEKKMFWKKTALKLKFFWKKYWKKSFFHIWRKRVPVPKSPGPPGAQFSGRQFGHSVVNDSLSLRNCFEKSCVALGAMTRKWVRPTRYTLRRNTAVIITDLI